MNKSRVYIFDVDGTLTPSRQSMTMNFYSFFKRWAKRNRFYLVSGSDLEKIKEQVSDNIINLTQGVFTCCGNQFYDSKQNLIYENKFELPKHIETYLKVVLANSPYPHRYGNHIEDRGSMVNFSIVGRDCTLEQREEFFKYDNEVKERQRIADSIKKHSKDLDAVIGGQISIDIYPRGKDKSQIFEHIEEIENTYCPDEYVFIGDRTEPGGNDFPLSYKMWEMKNCEAYQTSGYKETQSILLGLEDENNPANKKELND